MICISPLLSVQYKATNPLCSNCRVPNFIENLIQKTIWCYILYFFYKTCGLTEIFKFLNQCFARLWCWKKCLEFTEPTCWINRSLAKHWFKHFSTFDWLKITPFLLMVVMIEKKIIILWIFEYSNMQTFQVQNVAKLTQCNEVKCFLKKPLN